MYSDMSIRTMACSESNMNSASARASSVFPTPVGPTNRNVPIGRFGSCSPARERRSAFETASTASSWPMTRSWRRSSMCTSFSTSPSISFDTGMPVHLATTSATSSSSTSSLSIVRSPWSSDSLASCSRTSRSRSGIAPYRSSAARWRSASRSARSASRCACSSRSLASRIASIASFSPCQWAFISDERSRSSASSRSIDLAPLGADLVLLLAERLELDLELLDPTLHLVDLDRHRVDLDAEARSRLVDQVDRLVR